MSNSSENQFRVKYNISEEVCRALDVMGYHEPMEVQARVLKDVQEGKDLIVKSKTGSGKTAAFGIPVVDIIEKEENAPQVLVLTPTRELAVQVCEELAEIGRYKMIRCLPIYGKQPIHIQLRQLKQRVHVVVGTPGRLADMIKRESLKLENIKYLVIDEADELLKRGFIEEVEGIIKRVPRNRTTLLFSATMPAAIENICNKYMVAPDRIEVESNEAPIESIKQTYIDVTDAKKFIRLKEIIGAKNPNSCMIFCNTRDQVDTLVEKLRIIDSTSVALHGAMEQKDRLNAISEFKDGRVQYLVCTDIAARGIHIDKLDLVINYDAPNEEENYVHRIGRTGRAGEKGEAITFVNEFDDRRWRAVQHFIGYKVPKSTDKFEVATGEDGLQANGEMTKKTFVPRKKVKKHKDISRIRINAGKKKKIRAGDILGAISNLPDINSEDIGIIDIQDTCSYIEIHNNKVDLVEKGLLSSTVKGKNVTVRKIK